MIHHSRLGMAKQKKVKKKSLDYGEVIAVEPFGFEFAVFRGCKPFLKHCRKYYGVDMGRSVGAALGYVATMQHSSGRMAFLMMLSEIFCEETLYHEALHMAWDLLDYAGVKLTAKNHETLAYLQGYIAKTVKAKLWPELVSKELLT